MPTVLVAWLAQAQPAPPDPGPAPGSPAAGAVGEPAAPYAVGIAMGGGYRLSPAGDDVPPAWGMAVDVLLARRWGRMWDRLDLGFEVNFAFERYSQSAPSRSGVPGAGGSFEGVRTVAHYDAVVLQTVALAGSVRPWVGAGGGLDIGYFHTEEEAFRPGELRMARPLVQGAGGVDVAIRTDVSVGARIDYARPFRTPSYSTGRGDRVAPFGDRLVARLALLYRF